MAFIRRPNISARCTAVTIFAVSLSLLLLLLLYRRTAESTLTDASPYNSVFSQRAKSVLGNTLLWRQHPPPLEKDRHDHSLPPKSYMIALRTPEQLTMCTRHFHQFLNIVDDWNLTSVEPFIYHSDMFGLRGLAPYASVTYPFSRLFNVSKHNDYLSTCMNRTSDPETGKPTLFEPMVEFLKRSHRNVVVIHFMWFWNTLKHKHWRIPLHESLANVTDTFIDCTEGSRQYGLAAEVEAALQDEIRVERIQFPDSLPDKVDNFSVVKTFCVRRNVRISLRKFRDYLFSHIPNRNNVSIVFLHWQGRFTQPLEQDEVMNYINRCRIPLSKPFHSDKVIRASKAFVNSLGFGDQPYLSVHIRFEKVYMYAQSKKYPFEKYMNCCMSRLNHLMRITRAKYNIPAQNTLLIWDYSPYGSATCPLKHCGKETTKFIKQIDATATYLKPKELNIPEHPGLISIVESESLYGGKALITVGLGSYQTTIVEAFIERHQDPSDPNAAQELHFGHLCIPPEELHGMHLPIDPSCTFGT